MPDIGTLLFVLLAVVAALGPLYIAMMADFKEEKDPKENGE